MGEIHHVERALPPVDPSLMEWVQQAGKDLPFDLMITCGIRSAKEQEALYAQGRTTPGEIVTHAHASQSAHCHGGALDVVPMMEKGDIPWGNSAPGHSEWLDKLAQLGEHAMIHCLTWGGCGVGGWAHFSDLPHIEVSNWMDLPVIP